ncbi:MAG: hypothetical protein J6B51_00190 [Clostridia bacterium]|nr:hypothetical protein [Clostridia bacterium]
MNSVKFDKASPLWLRDGGREPNTTVLFETLVASGADTIMRMSGNSSYQVYINDKFIFFGPARAGRGFFRVDELPVGKYLSEKENRVVVLVSGYNCDNFYFPNGQPFFCAEFISDGNIFGQTGGDSWKTYLYSRKLRKVQKYSFQRTFVEAYDLTEGEPLSTEGLKEVETEKIAIDTFIEREISYPELPEEEMIRFVGGGSAVYDYEKEQTMLAERKDNDLDIVSSVVADCAILTNGAFPENGSVVLENAFAIAEMKTDITGFIKLDLFCESDTTLILIFDELFLDGKVSRTRMGCENEIIYRLKKGHYTLITAEPYTFKYLNLISVGGEICVDKIGVIRLDFNESEIVRTLNSKADEQIKRIYDAAVQTFRQNTLDIYMDCPSRERAGWLCDSFFTSRVERTLTGKSTVEHCFLENFLMEKEFKDVKGGMLPMCYPSDHTSGNYIPNWAMWYVVELREYFYRTGDRTFIDNAKDKMYALLGFLRGFENADGLLDKLGGWVFVEWSRCNSLVQHINYPSNMLYYLFKKALCELYGDESLGKEADELRKVIREKSRIDQFFCDNSVYGDDGIARLSGEITETCQYYAFFTGVASKEEDGELWNIIVNDFGPDRAKTGKWKKIHPSNAFIGNYLRCDLLRMAGLNEKLDEDIRGYFDYMAQTTGTLWEHVNTSASCNHGFASHVLVWLDHLGYMN